MRPLPPLDATEREVELGASILIDATGETTKAH